MNMRNRMKPLERGADALKAALEAESEFDQARRELLVQEARRLLGEAGALARERPRDPGPGELHARVLALYRAALDAAYPENFAVHARRLGEGDLSGLETAVRFLEADPWFFHSGFVKAELIRSLKRLEIPPAAVERLRRVVLNVVDRCDRREFRHYCRLARKVDSPDLRRDLALRIQSDDPDVARRARWAMHACEQPG